MSVKILALSAAMASATPANAVVPAGVAGLLPANYRVLASVALDPAADRSFEIVALGRRDEAGGKSASSEAPARALLIFRRRGNQFILIGRNDDVIMRADEGGQCDPFLDGAATIATKGRFFTVENGVACGQHWTDYITFRLDPRTGDFVFDNERRESWSMNTSSAPGAEALVRDGPPQVIRDPPGHLTRFAAWRRLP